MGHLSTLLKNHHAMILRTMSEERSPQQGDELLESHSADLLAALLSANEKSDLTAPAWIQMVAQRVVDGLEIKVPMLAIATMERTIRHLGR